MVFFVEVCFGEFVLLVVVVSGGILGFSYIWSNVAFSFVIMVMFNEMIIYIVIVIDQCGFIVIIDVMVIVSGVLEVIFIGQGQFCEVFFIVEFQVIFQGNGLWFFVYFLNGIF